MVFASHEPGGIDGTSALVRALLAAPGDDLTGCFTWNNRPFPWIALRGTNLHPNLSLLREESIPEGAGKRDGEIRKAKSDVQSLSRDQGFLRIPEVKDHQSEDLAACGRPKILSFLNFSIPWSFNPLIARPFVSYLIPRWRDSARGALSSHVFEGIGAMVSRARWK